MSISIEQPCRVLIVDAESLLAAGLQHLLTQKGGLDVVGISSGDPGELRSAIIRFHPDVVVLPCADPEDIDPAYLSLIASLAVSRLVCVSPDCNTVRVHHLYEVSVAKIEDLFPFHPTPESVAARDDPTLLMTHVPMRREHREE